MPRNSNPLDQISLKKKIWKNFVEIWYFSNFIHSTLNFNFFYKKKNKFHLNFENFKNRNEWNAAAIFRIFFQKKNGGRLPWRQPQLFPQKSRPVCWTPRHWRRCRTFSFISSFIAKNPKKMFWLLLYLLSWPPVRSVADVNDPESHSRRINEFMGPADPLSAVYLSRDA